MLRLTLLGLLLAGEAAWGGPYMRAGDMGLRQDIQRLAAHGIIKGATSTWPLAWGPIIADIEAADATGLRPDLADALARVQSRASWETRTHYLTFDAQLGVADKATRIRSFQNTPRGRGELSVGFNWIGDNVGADVNVQYVNAARDSEAVRIDDSMLGAVFGNWSIAASTQQRWWGPGWDGSIILSSNARPIPAIVLDRVFTDAPQSKWLRWLGPWDLNVMFGQLESGRAIPNARFVGMRFNFRPWPALEFGVSRTAMWCGDGRPCGSGVFVDLLLGRDNLGEDNITAENEPGNQLGGFDARWTPAFLGRDIGLYAQVIGEDEAGNFPTRFLGQVGIDWSGYLFRRWSTQAFLEYAGTACRFEEPDSVKLYNCGYNHATYETGYRFRGRPIGHGADNDAELLSAGVVLVDAAETEWRALLRAGTLNEDGAPDPRNVLTATAQDLLSIDLAHSRSYAFGKFELGLGYEIIDDALTGESTNNARLYLQWKSTY